MGCAATISFYIKESTEETNLAQWSCYRNNRDHISLSNKTKWIKVETVGWIMQCHKTNIKGHTNFTLQALKLECSMITRSIQCLRIAWVLVSTIAFNMQFKEFIGTTKWIPTIYTVLVLRNDRKCILFVSNVVVMLSILKYIQNVECEASIFVSLVTYTTLKCICMSNLFLLLRL